MRALDKINMSMLVFVFFFIRYTCTFTLGYHSGYSPSGSFDPYLSQYNIYNYLTEYRKYYKSMSSRLNKHLSELLDCTVYMSR